MHIHHFQTSHFVSRVTSEIKSAFNTLKQDLSIGQGAGVRNHKPAKTPSHPSRLSPFAIFDNTHYSTPNANLSAFGVPKSTVIYEYGWLKSQTDQGKLPDEKKYKDTIKYLSANTTGPIVLDFESLYLKGDPKTAATHYDLLKQLIIWAKEAAPGRMVGFYGVLNNTDPQYLPLAQKLSQYEDAFFPTLYTMDGSEKKWDQRLSAAMQKAKQVNPNLPVYPYIWPEFHDKGPLAGQSVPQNFWKHELEQSLRAGASGVVVWSQSGEDKNTDWVNATGNFLKQHPDVKP